MSVCQITDVLWQIHAGVFPSNSYVWRNCETGDLFLIDTGLDAEALGDAVETIGGPLRAVICTHGHFDHMGSAAVFQDSLGLEVFLHSDDMKIAKTANFLLMAFKIPARVKTPRFTNFAGKSGTFEVAGVTIRHRHVPGHTPGSCFIQIDDICFTGDSLYASGVGLANTPGEIPEMLRQSLLEVMDEIPDDTLICPGHGPTGLFGNIRSGNRALKAFLGTPPEWRPAELSASRRPISTNEDDVYQMVNSEAPKSVDEAPVAVEPSGVAIIGVGHRLGSVVEDNETLCANLEITPDWIIEKTGIQRRYLARPDETASGLSLSAAKDAMASAGVDASQIDMVICCTFSADYRFPALAAKVHADLGIRGGQMMDVQANCAGFVAGLTVASDRMRLDPEIRNALVIGVELNSRFISRSNADAAVYHSDGAGAVILGRRPGAGVMASAFHTDSSNYEAVRVRGGGSTWTGRDRPFDPAIDTMELNGIATWKQAITHLPSVIKRACKASGTDPKSADFFIFHQANLRLIEYLVRKLGRDMSSTFTNVERVGNSGAASVPIALSEAVQNGKMRDGDTVVIAAVGAGFNFGASVWRWVDVRADTVN